MLSQKAVKRSNPLMKEEHQRLVDFFSLLIQIDKRINFIKKIEQNKF